MTEKYHLSGEIAWQPTPQIIEQAHLTAFMRRHGLTGFSALLQRSTGDVAWFTEALLDYLDIRFYQPYTQVVDLSRGIQWPRWCVGGQLNIVHNCLDKYIGGPVAGRVALRAENEAGQTTLLTYDQLYRQVNQAANALRALGLGKGDAVGIFMPMVPEIVVALLAIAKIGGVILPLFSGYGPSALAARLAAVDAKALFTCDGAFRRGKPVEMKRIADQAAAQVPSLQHMIVLEQAGLQAPLQPGRDYTWAEWVASQPEQAETERTAAEDILMVIYTSGTSGHPKGAVHTHCGFPVKAAQDMAFGTDLHPGQLIYWMTDLGWMMGPWLVFGSLLLGGAFLLYDGAPDYPGPDRLWALIAGHRVNVAGISPTLIRALIPYGEEPFRKHDLSNLQAFASTGEPWNPDSWLWLFEKVGGGRLPIINYSGGTEISGGIVMGNPLLPLKPCSFSAPCPGMAADVFDEAGQPVRGQVGELVIRAPWIGMTRGFWKDPQRYLDTYWSRWPDTWVHGDFCAIDADGFWYILGRSDDTIKVAGKRLGPAEVESLAVEHPRVLDAAVIGIDHPLKGSEVVLFCVLASAEEQLEALRREIQAQISAAIGKALAPHQIYFVSDLPRTRNAKLMRRMIRAAFLGQDPGDTSALVNPQALEAIRAAR